MSLAGYFEESGREPVKRDKDAGADEGGEFYESVEDYDPVLRDHCRLVPEAG